MAVLSPIIQLFNEGEINKNKYISHLKKCETEIRKILDSKGYAYNPDDRINLFKVSDEIRLAEAKEKESRIAENPSIAISEFVKSLDRRFNDFLKVYNFGWCRELAIESYGSVKIQLNCRPHMPILPDNPISSKMNFEKQIQTLKDIGFIMGKDEMNDICFVDSGINHELMKSFWEKRGARQMYITTRGNAIYEVTFHISIPDMVNLDSDTENICLFVSEDLNEDEKARLKKLFKDVESTIQISDLALLNTCGYLVESYFAEISDIFGYDGPIKKTVDDRHAKSRKINTEIREIEQRIGDFFPAEIAKDTVKDISKKFERMTINKIGFSVHDFVIDKYGYITGKLFYVSGHNFAVGKEMSDEDTKATFHTIGESRASENLFIIDDYENKKNIINILRSSVPSIDISEITSVIRDDEFVIKNIQFSIRNAIDLVNLPEGIIGKYE